MKMSIINNIAWKKKSNIEAINGIDVNSKHSWLN